MCVCLYVLSTFKSRLLQISGVSPFNSYFFILSLLLYARLKRRNAHGKRPKFIVENLTKPAYNKAVHADSVFSPEPVSFQRNN